MTLIGCPFLTVIIVIIVIGVIKLWLSSTKNMHDSHCYHKTSSNFPVSESMINPRTTISFGTRG